MEGFKRAPNRSRKKGKPQETRQRPKRRGCLILQEVNLKEKGKKRTVNSERTTVRDQLVKNRK